MADRAAFRIPSNVLYREVDGQMVLLDVDREEYFGLNDVGAATVAEITSGRVEDALERLGDRFDVDPSRLRRDTEELIASLVEARLLVPDEPG